MSLGLVEPPLVGQDLSDVAVAERAIGRSVGAVTARPGSLVECDGLVPAAVEVGEQAEAVQHGGLVLGIAKLLTELERPPGVDRLLAPATFEQRPIECAVGVCQRTQLADRLRFGDRLAARRDRLRPSALAVADAAEVRPDLRPARERLWAVKPVHAAKSPLQPADGGRQRRAVFRDLRVPVADPGLCDRVVGQQSAGFGQRLCRRVRLPHASQSLAKLLPGLRERARIVSEPGRSAGVDRPPIQLRGIRVRETLGGLPCGDHRIAVRACVVPCQCEVL
jgi:hypothetical protein